MASRLTSALSKFRALGGGWCRLLPLPHADLFLSFHCHCQTGSQWFLIDLNQVQNGSSCCFLFQLSRELSARQAKNLSAVILPAELIYREMRGSSNLSNVVFTTSGEHEKRFSGMVWITPMGTALVILNFHRSQHVWKLVDCKTN